MKRRLVNITILAALLLVFGAVWVRLAPSDPARWHVDPRVAEVPDSANYALIRGEDAPRFDLPPGELAARLDGIAGAWPRTERLAGSVDTGWMTYVTRSRWMAFPDYTSIIIVPEEGGARLFAFARARFGERDFGVNAARLDAWLAALRGQ